MVEMFFSVCLHYFFSIRELLMAKTGTNTKTHPFAIFLFFFLFFLQYYKLLIYTFRANLSIPSLQEQPSWSVMQLWRNDQSPKTLLIN